MSEFVFPDIDTSYWLTTDKDWMAERKEGWLKVARMLENWHSKKNITAMKNYYLKGKLPQWNKYSSTSDHLSPLGVFSFLWLHPSWDRSVLQNLRDQYLASEQIGQREAFDMSLFISFSTTMACIDYSDGGEDEVPQTDGHNEMLFDILMGDINQPEMTLARTLHNGRKWVYTFPESDLFGSINDMGRWLCVKTMKAINQDMLYQYDKVLVWWYQSCSRDEDYFEKMAQADTMRQLTIDGLWRIYHFDTQQEGDTPRSRFVTKMRRILDEKPFIREFSDMWQAVKAGEVEIESPWVF